MSELSYAPDKVQAAFEHRRLIKHLRNAGDAAAISLAEIVTACRTSNPCRSGACPFCKVDYQGAGVRLVRELIDKPARVLCRNRRTAVTILPAGGFVVPDALTTDVFRLVAAEILAALTRYTMPPCIGNVEVSFNDEAAIGKLPDHWCVHTHLYMFGWQSAKAEKQLRSSFPRSPFAARPVWMGPLDDDDRGRLYPFKPTSVRREAYINDGVEGRKPFRDQRRRDLRDWQAVALAKVEHEVGFDGRLLIHEIDDDAVKRALDGLGWARDGP